MATMSFIRQVILFNFKMDPFTKLKLKLVSFKLYFHCAKNKVEFYANCVDRMHSDFILVILQRYLSFLLQHP